MRGAAPRVVRLAHPVSVRDAIRMTAAVQVPVVELRIGGNGVIGGLVPRVGGDPDAQAAWVIGAFEKRFQRRPVVKQVIVAPGATSGQERRLGAALARAPQAPSVDRPVRLATPGGAATRGGAPTKARQVPQDFDSHFPSIWWGDAYTSTASGDAKKATDNWFEYESAYGARPSDFPEDWGLELGITSTTPT
ncbi:MAG: hypothetical protein ACRC35_01475 [Angustibacter sp.]